MSEKRCGPVVTILASMASSEEEGRSNVNRGREYPALASFFLSLPGQWIAIMKNHQHKACKHNDTGQPSQRITRPAFICIYRLAIDKQFSETKSRNHSGEVSVVIHAHA